MTGSRARMQLLHGSEALIAPMRTLRAGPLTLLLDGIDLRYLRIGATELVRRVYTAVRDGDWDTIPGAITVYEVLEDKDRFRIEFQAHHAGSELDFSWRGTITGDETGRVEFLFDGRAEQACVYNRIGLCVHHPWRETAGAPYIAHTPEGDVAGSFPDLIGPQALIDGSYRALFPPFDRLELELPAGGRLNFEFEGDLWEVEDHRNWTDANFKAYSTPVSLGRPAPLAAGQRLRQRLVVTTVGVSAAAVSEGPVRLWIGPATGARVPAIGLAQDRDHHRPSSHEAELLGVLAPSHLRAEVHLGSEDWRQALTAAQETAAAIGCRLEVSLHLLEEHAEEPEVASALAGGPSVARVLVINADSRTGTSAETTRPQLVDAARTMLGPTLPGAQFFGGTEIYFAEINRTRPALTTWEGLCYSVTPQIHAFGDVDIVENLDAQGETLRAARAIAGDKPVVVSPITLRRRINFHASGNPLPDVPGELPDSVDVRQSSLLGAAWTAGSLKYIAEGGAAAATYYESTGWRGVLERSEGPELPDTFRSVSGEPFPLFHPLADAIEWEGAEVLACTSSDVLAAVGFAVRRPAGLCLLVANLTPVTQDVLVGPVDGGLSMRRLNESTAALAAADPKAFRANSERLTATGDIALTLAPYEVVRLDTV